MYFFVTFISEVDSSRTISRKLTCNIRRLKLSVCYELFPFAQVNLKFRVRLCVCGYKF